LVRVIDPCIFSHFMCVLVHHGIASRVHVNSLFGLRCVLLATFPNAFVKNFAKLRYKLCFRLWLCLNCGCLAMHCRINDLDLRVDIFPKVGYCRYVRRLRVWSVKHEEVWESGDCRRLVAVCELRGAPIKSREDMSNVQQARKPCATADRSVSMDEHALGTMGGNVCTGSLSDYPDRSVSNLHIELPGLTATMQSRPSSTRTNCSTERANLIRDAEGLSMKERVCLIS
jgi:hypothetical protein